jgi:hypothetical protein
MYIFRRWTKPLGGGRKAAYNTAPAIHATEIAETRATAKQNMRDLGFVTVENTGRVLKTRIRVEPKGERDEIRTGYGTFNSNGWPITINRTAAGVKEYVRKVRPEEELIIAEYDRKIERLEAELKEERAARNAWVAEAWSKAHVVRLSEVEETVTGRY